MIKLPKSPEGRRNRIGCLVIAAVLALFVALYLLVGFNAQPGNNVTEEIHTLPAR
jgi:hypothetical protein